MTLRLHDPDRAQAAELLAASVAEGSATMQAVAASAVHRLLGRGAGAVYGRGLFDPEEFRRLANQIRDTNATAELLGRSWIALRAQQFERSQAQRQFSESPTSFRIFEEGPRLHPMPPKEAIEYFRRLVPMPGVDPQRFGQWLEREAFTLAATAERILQERIKAEIQKRLDTGERIRQAPGDIQAILDSAGVSVRNPQYCFLPGTMVEGAIVAASKANYDGPAVQIETNDGRRLAVTINHPVLTARGWKAAGDIEEGENLLSYGPSVESFDAVGVGALGRQGPERAANDCGHRISTFAPVRPPSQRRAVHNQNRPARIEDVFEAIFEQGSPRNDIKRPVAPLDFHGDATFMDGYVRCVRADGELLRNNNPSGGQLFDQIGFMLGNVAPAKAASHSCGLLDSFGDSSLESFANELRLTDSLIHPGFFGVRAESSPISSMRIGKSAHLDPGLFHASDKRLMGDVQLYGNLVRSLPGLVTTNRVIKIKRISHTGHVYNLQTKTGFIVSQGIITSNCEMVFRTNMNESYLAGAQRELAAHTRTFPAFQYTNPDDGRSREHHADKNGRYYPSTVPFTRIRGTNIADLANCRCGFIPVSRVEWAELQAAGHRFSPVP